MEIDINKLDSWFSERPKWIQVAARKLSNNKKFTREDLNELVDICKAEATNQKIRYEGINEKLLIYNDNYVPLKLISLSDLIGINALVPKNPLNFGNSQLSIVFGRNGSGKSGYVRLLKHISGKENHKQLLANIYKDPNQTQSAKITYLHENQTVEEIWTGSLIPNLTGIDIFDTDCGSVYVDEEKEVSYEPSILRLFTDLTALCEFLKTTLEKEKLSYICSKPSMPAQFNETLESNWYNSLSSKTTSEEMEEYVAWSEEKEKILSQILGRLSDENPTMKLEEYHGKGLIVNRLIENINKVFKELSEEKFNNFIEIKNEAKCTRHAADIDATNVFANSPLNGIGHESWRLMWEAARKFSEEKAYPTVPFPNVEDEALCVLCQQPLNDVTRARFISFEHYIKGELQNKAVSAEKKLQLEESSFNQITDIQNLLTQVNYGGIFSKEILLRFEDFCNKLKKRKTSFLNVDSVDELPPLPSLDILDELSKSQDAIEKNIKFYEEYPGENNRPQLLELEKKFNANKWLSQQKDSIYEEVMRLKKIDEIEAAISLTNTMALSRKKSELTEELITKAYIDRFLYELELVNAKHINVTIKKTRAEVGKVYHKVSLCDAIQEVKTVEILSEGEYRIVSLAAFLADTEGKEANTPFVFDDPISSLDQFYEDAVAKRLVLLSKHRQVIIFTHRLSFVGYLDKYADKESIKCNLVCLSNRNVGDVGEMPLSHFSKPKNAVNSLLNGGLSSAKAAYKSSDQEYEKEVKYLCGNIRIIIENIIEETLLDGIIKRHSPEIQSKGKIEHLALIEVEDCNFIDSLMTKYSTFEHSQSEESPVNFPDPVEIEKDLQEILNFILKIKKRYRPNN